MADQLTDDQMRALLVRTPDARTLAANAIARILLDYTLPAHAPYDVRYHAAYLALGLLDAHIDNVDTEPKRDIRPRAITSGHTVDMNALAELYSAPTAQLGASVHTGQNAPPAEPPPGWLHRAARRLFG